ncbi:MAG: glycosyltransferase [Streptosporangiaceae bacterium]|jgi:hopene-associated glycosyltransferase HpnB
MLIAAAACALAAAAWAYLLAAHGGFWLTGQRLPPPAAGPQASAPGRWPALAVVIPARDEAAVLPGTLPALLGQDYPAELTILLVDDQSTDGTAQVAAALGEAAGWTVRRSAGQPAGALAGRPGPGAEAGRILRVISGSPPPAGWAGKVWAMSQGLAAAGRAEYVLFTDADIRFGPGAVEALVRAARGRDLGLVSQMALLRAATFWERLLVPAFVYFFAQLYPFRRVNRPGTRTAAAAGGCMLARRDALARAGGLAAIRGARIDDVALARLLKRRAGAACWLGLSTSMTSEREYARLPEIWDMIARSAYTQLRYSPAALGGTIAGLLWLYVLPPAGTIAGAAAALLGAGPAAGWLAAAGAAGWIMMSASYVPMLRLYRLSPLRSPVLPVIAGLYAAMTADSARRHRAGRGGEWKGRVIRPARPASRAGRADSH